MLNYRVGDLFSTNLPLILHGCNAHGVMGSGVAKVVREKYPEVYVSYRNWCKKNTPDAILGKFYAERTWDNKYTIINAITQRDFGAGIGIKQVSYDAMDELFCDLNDLISTQGFRGLAMPRIGAGLGGGDWRVIESMIMHRFTDVRVLVYVLDKKELPYGCIQIAEDRNSYYQGQP